jgi:hypothetical protein
LIHRETPSESELTDKNLLLQRLSGRTNIDPVTIKEMLLELGKVRQLMRLLLMGREDGVKYLILENTLQ